VALIRTLIAASPVAGFDETTLRSGPAGEKKLVHGAFTGLYSAFHLGTRSILNWSSVERSRSACPRFPASPARRTA